MRAIILISLYCIIAQAAWVNKAQPVVEFTTATYHDLVKNSKWDVLLEFYDIHNGFWFNSINLLANIFSKNIPNWHSSYQTTRMDSTKYQIPGYKIFNVPRFIFFPLANVSDSRDVPFFVNNAIEWIISFLKINTR